MGKMEMIQFDEHTSSPENKPSQKETSMPTIDCSHSTNRQTSNFLGFHIYIVGKMIGSHFYFIVLSQVVSVSFTWGVSCRPRGPGIIGPPTTEARSGG